MESNNYGIKNKLLTIINEGDTDSSDYAIALFLLEHYTSIKDINIIDMAEECYVDRATIRRFFKNNGFNNFQYFKNNFNDEFEQKFYNRVPFDNYTSYINDLNEKIFEMISSYALKRDKTPDIEEVTRRIYEASEVLMFGDESMYGIMYNIQQHLLTVGKVSFVITNPYKEKNRIVTISDNDLAIVLSTTGTYFEENRELFQKLTCKKILISLYKKKEWEECFDYVALMVSNGENKDVDIYRKYAMTYYIDIMLNAYKMKFVKQGDH